MVRNVPNSEHIVIADVDLADLKESRLNGTTIPVLDRRRDVWERAVLAVDARASLGGDKGDIQERKAKIP
ncbi:MAG: hypothetical protein ABI724_14815 [Betaproteobacteria bacterium]